MKLKEKLNDSIITNIDIRDSENRMYYEYNHLELAENCEKIADDYAIGFAEWIANEFWILSSNDLWYHKSDGNPEEATTIEKLLEIYKQTL